MCVAANTFIPVIRINFFTFLLTGEDIFCISWLAHVQLLSLVYKS